jgi:hypothetical protein
VYLCVCVCVCVCACVCACLCAGGCVYVRGGQGQGGMEDGLGWTRDRVSRGWQ